MDGQVQKMGMKDGVELLRSLYNSLQDVIPPAQGMGRPDVVGVGELIFINKLI